MLSIHHQRHSEDDEGNMQHIQDHSRSRKDAEKMLSIHHQRHGQEDEGNMKLIQDHSRS